MSSTTCSRTRRGTGADRKKCRRSREMAFEPPTRAADVPAFMGWKWCLSSSHPCRVRFFPDAGRIHAGRNQGRWPPLRRNVDRLYGRRTRTGQCAALLRPETGSMRPGRGADSVRSPPREARPRRLLRPRRRRLPRIARRQAARAAQRHDAGRRRPRRERTVNARPPRPPACAPRSWWLRGVRLHPFVLRRQPAVGPAGAPSRRFAGTATSISSGIGRSSPSISATKASRVRPAKRALCAFSQPIVDTSWPW